LLKECNKALLDADSISNGIQRRQLFEDIKFMESESGWNIDLQRINMGYETYYRYADPKFSVFTDILPEGHAKELRIALGVIRSYSNPLKTEWIEEWIPRFEKEYDLSVDTMEWLEFDFTPYLSGLEYLPICIEALTYKKALNVTYKAFVDKKLSNLVFHPWYLKQYNKRWFLIGYTPDNDRTYTTLALDRIKDLWLNRKVKYVPNKDFDFAEMFEDIVGVSIPDGAVCQRIMLRVDIDLVPYFQTKPLHGSQKVINKKPDYYDYEYEVIINYELKQTLLMHGSRVKVLGPNAFREEIEEELKKMMQRYI
jgi:predicted DNA-binding transcriptional regulator YafY